MTCDLEDRVQGSAVYKWPCLNDVCSSCFGIYRNEKDQEYCRYRNNPGEGDVSELYPATLSV
jgi:hypothetical protein